ncbi:MAG: SpoIIIAH-like family protein [Oscillospiraceae bacterium]|jgi:stage III sporulation protein AH|nr:SpoIIIAH-like family protein [Oscillospiraceae bacterium]
MANSKKRNLLLATLVVALACAVFVNWYYTRPPADEPANGKAQTTTVRDNQQVNLGDAQYVGNVNDEEAAVAANASAEYFAAAKLRRQSAQDKAKETLSKVIADNKSNEKAIESANKALTELAEAIKKEADIENLITAKLAGDCVVILNGESVEVIVQGGKLNDQSVLQVKDICVNQTKLPPGAVTVVEQK